HRVQGGQLFIDNSPKVIAGRKYQLVIIRKETEETVFAPQQLLLTGVDDTAPVLLSGSSGHKALTMSEPLRLTFDEPVSAEGYQVIKQFKDYTDSSDVDISNRFELVNIAAQSISLRLLPGQLLDANATYRIVINGIADSAGNLALGGSLTEAGRYSANLTAPDTLAPRNLRLVRLTDGIDVNEAMQLTKGRSHRFMLSAIDNYTAASAINYRYRIATAFGAPETGWLQPGRENVFTFDALEHHVYMEVLVEARDGNNSPVAIQTFRASLRDPVIELESFHTNPAEPEESVRAEMHFTLSGDIDTVGQTVISVDKIKQGTIDASDKYNPVTGHVFASFVNPKIRDIIPADAPVAPVQMNTLLQVTYGFGYTKVFNESYTLYLDRTPPSLEIVSPANGDFVAIGDRTDVILKAFDKYGIETVEVSYNGGVWQELSDPTRFSFEATVDDIEHG